MHSPLVFLCLISMLSVTSGLTEEEYYRRLKDTILENQPRLREISKSYRQNGFSSVANWMNTKQIIVKEETNLTEFLSFSMWQDDEVCRHQYTILYDQFIKAEQYLKLHKSPSGTAHILKTGLLYKAGAKLATNAQDHPTPADMIDIVDDIVELESIVGSTFGTPNKELNDLYASLIDFSYAGDISPVNILLIKHWTEKYRRFIEQNSGLSFVDMLKKKLDKAEQIGGAMTKIEIINCSAAIGRYVRLAEEFHSLMIRINAILKVNEYTCDEWVCKPTIELETYWEKPPLCVNINLLQNPIKD